MNHIEAYAKLSKKSRETAYLGSAMSLLHWDQRTGIPPKGHPHRIAQLTALAGMLHQRMTDPEIGELLDRVEDSDLVEDPLSVEGVNIREWRWSYDRKTRIPEKLAVEIARATGEGESVWERARPENDWDLFKPYLERIVALKREETHALGYENEPYDALLDGYERGVTARDLEPILGRLADALVELLDRIRGSSVRRNPDLPDFYFPVPDQQIFAESVLHGIGYDMDAGRMDLSAHPFTTGIGPGDVRITTRYGETHFNEGFFAAVHEAGHAMYHQGLPLDHWGNPICRPISLGINESQSRMWENMVARSPSFWRHFYPPARERFPCLTDVSMDDFMFTVNEVRPSLIRVEADEVTYNLHILLRFQLELDLTRGDLEVDRLPEAWNEKTREYLGLTPPDPADGVMQDVHWSGGAIGYFPTYTLGNLYAAQIFSRAERDLGGLDECFARGEFRPLLEWLRERVHSRGARYLPRELLRQVTDEDLEPRYLIDYLGKKYGALYGISSPAL